MGCPFSSLEDAENDQKGHPFHRPYIGREREMMSISWVACQSKMDVPFNRFLCLQTNKRDTLSVFLRRVPFPRLKMQKTAQKGHPFHRPYMGREREREKGNNHEHQLGLLTCSLFFLLCFSNGNEQEKRKIRNRGKMKTSTIFSLPDFCISLACPHLSSILFIALPFRVAFLLISPLSFLSPFSSLVLLLISKTHKRKLLFLVE